MAAQMESIAVPNIEELFRPTHDERARQSLVSMLRKHAIIDLRAKVRSEYEDKVAPELSARGQTVKDWRDIESAMADDPVHRIYSSLRYNAQEMCYQSVQPAVERALPSMIDLARDLAARNPTGGSLQLDPSLPIPRYLNALDVHLAPGWVTAEHTHDDVAQGAVVAFGGKVFTGQHPYRKRPGVVAESIAYWIKKTRPGFNPRRILDLGTTTGKNLLPYKTAFPKAEAHGIDCGAPVLRYAHALAEHEGIAVHFSQQNAEHTNFVDGHFDLIVSSFFLHEIPGKATRAVLNECFRLLAPGGLMIHMELPDAASVTDYENFFWNWDTTNNNEPFYTSYRDQDPIALAAGAGFDRAKAFKLTIPDSASFGEERYAKFLAGEIQAPAHGSGGWFIHGAEK
ncbi:MAG: class I SAM-dependent methyltransferase [Gammaproteobacteria bacterium]|jgi:ubiquinone/menaquinone biosynthesis C-methylase UbiE|nr:class I SAM-dependent methyltransferase [Gammaproteobacteria bacterium]